VVRGGMSKRFVTESFLFMSVFMTEARSLFQC
jgi:hypothetical protein